MPLNIKSQITTALSNVNNKPELYTPTEVTIPLETKINDLKEANPSKYREYLSVLTKSANSGNEKARELLGKIGEDAARQRRGYEKLNTAMYIPALLAASSIAAPAISTVGKGSSWLYKQLPKWFRSTIDVGLTADGVRNTFSNNGIQKTIREAKAGNYGRAVLSGIGDAADIIGGYNLGKNFLSKVSPIVQNKYRKNIIAKELLNNVKNSDSPTLIPVYHTTTYLGNSPRFTNGTQIGFHVGLDRTAPNFFLKNWKDLLQREGTPTIRTGFYIKYPNRTIDTPDLSHWDGSTLLNEVNRKGSELGTRISSNNTDINISRDLYNNGYLLKKGQFYDPKGVEDIFTSRSMNTPISSLNSEKDAWELSGQYALEAMREANIDALQYINKYEGSPNKSIAIMNPNRLWLSKEINITEYPNNRAPKSNGFNYPEAKFNDSLPQLYFKNGGRVKWKK